MPAARRRTGRSNRLSRAAGSTNHRPPGAVGATRQVWPSARGRWEATPHLNGVSLISVEGSAVRDGDPGMPRGDLSNPPKRKGATAANGTVRAGYAQRTGLAVTVRRRCRTIAAAVNLPACQESAAPPLLGRSNPPRRPHVTTIPNHVRTMGAHTGLIHSVRREHSDVCTGNDGSAVETGWHTTRSQLNPLNGS